MAKSSLGYSALDIAKWFINATDQSAGDAMTHLKVQKLVYYAQGWSLALFGRPLFDEELEAWAHGPVAKTVWNNYKDMGFNLIPRQKITKSIDERTANLLEGVNEEYGIYTAKRLERMTHKETPWREARGDLPPEARSNSKLSKETMKSFFTKLKKQNGKRDQ